MASACMGSRSSVGSSSRCVCNEIRDAIFSHVLQSGENVIADLNERRLYMLKVHNSFKLRS